jgi:Lar family restriction alleviation protein
MTQNTKDAGASLKSCPFCCSDDLFTQSALGRRQVVCETCEASGPTEETDEEAIEAWNRLGLSRSATAAPTAEQAEAQAPIYQVLTGDKWVDSTAAEYAVVSNGKRIVYAAPVAQEWQPIEAAPKDQEIWAFNGEQARMVWSEGPDWALWIWADLLLADADPSPDQPTHYMPLPAAPASSTGEQEVGS